MTEPLKKGLCLTRKLQESIVIETAAGPVEITVIKSTFSYARLFFCAPESVSIMRKEVYDKKSRRPGSQAPAQP